MPWGRDSLSAEWRTIRSPAGLCPAGIAAVHGLERFNMSWAQQWREDLVKWGCALRCPQSIRASRKAARAPSALLTASPGIVPRQFSWSDVGIQTSPANLPKGDGAPLLELLAG